MGGVLGEGGRVLGGGGADSQVRPKEDLQVNIRDFHCSRSLWTWADSQVRPQEDIQVNKTFMSSWSLWMGIQSSTVSRRSIQVNIRDFHEFLFIMMGGQSSTGNTKNLQININFHDFFVME